MKTITALIDKLTEIEKSVGLENNSTIRNQIIDAQDYALEIQREIAEVLRGSLHTAPELSLVSPPHRSGWRNALAYMRLPFLSLKVF
jgi:hypothetical protein